jgi:hypothetical protein
MSHPLKWLATLVDGRGKRSATRRTVGGPVPSTFLVHLAALDLPPKTIQKHVYNMSIDRFIPRCRGCLPTRFSRGSYSPLFPTDLTPFMTLSDVRTKMVKLGK